MKWEVDNLFQYNLRKKNYDDTSGARVSYDWIFVMQPRASAFLK